jgi:hypothetical protein
MLLRVIFSAYAGASATAATFEFRYSPTRDEVPRGPSAARKITSCDLIRLVLQVSDILYTSSTHCTSAATRYLSFAEG